MTPNVTSTTFLTDLMNFFRDRCLEGLALLVPDASYLVYMLGILEVCMIWGLYFGEYRFQQLITKVIKIGFFFFLVNNWKDLTIDTLFESLKMAGLVASNATLSIDPSFVLDKGIFLTKEILASIIDAGNWSSVLGGLMLLLVKLIFSLIVIGSFGFAAIQIMLVTIEFYICASLSVILVPFGLNKYTSFLFERIVGAMFAFGIKMMFMTFILGVGMTIFQTWNTSISADAKVQELIQASFGALVYALLVWKIPDVAASYLNGTPSMELGNAGTAMAGGAVRNAMGAPALSLKGAGGVAAAAKAANGGSMAAKAGNFAKNLGQIGMGAAKQKAFGSNFIQARNRSLAILARNEKKK